MIQIRKDDGSIKEIAVGCVFRIYCQDTKIWSDEWGTGKYAQYWDENKQSIMHHLLGVYGLASDDSFDTADVDITPENLAKVEQFHYNNTIRELLNEQRKSAQEIVRGSQVEVYAGRTGKGTVGEVVVMIERPYGMGYHSSMEIKLGIATSNEMIDVEVNGKTYKNHKDMVWVWARNCKRLDVTEPDMAVIERLARSRTNNIMKQYQEVSRAA